MDKKESTRIRFGLQLMLSLGGAITLILIANYIITCLSLPPYFSFIVGLVILGVSIFICHQLVTRPFNAIIEVAQALTQGDLNSLREDVKNIAQKRNDEFGDLSRALIEMSENFKEKTTWYEAMLDAIPFPLSVTDMDMNWTFINKPTEDFLGVKRKDVIGRQCNNWNANICNTENCGIARLRNNFKQTFFNQMGGDFQVDTSYLLDSKGERVGHIEVVQDISRLVAGTQYQATAVEKIGGYLGLMKEGFLNFNIEELPESNQHTEEVRQNLIKINESLSEAKSMLSKTISHVADNATLVQLATEELAMASNQSGQATAQIAATIQQVAKGIAEQTAAVTKVADVGENMKKIVDRVSTGVKEQANAVNQASQVVNKITGASGISEQVGFSAEKVQELGKHSEQIGAIVNTIEDIASQTNLLALNAAIEAARAGEHGKGFAVVADEVRKLAERSSASTKEISSIISNIQTIVLEAVAMTTTVAKEINSASDELTNAINSVSRVVEENTSAAESLAASASEVMQSVENIASVSEENSASVEEISASTEEMNAQAEEVSTSSQSLADMAKNLKEVVEQFKL
jgi:methyl-accepting chemotaxis protein